VLDPRVLRGPPPLVPAVRADEPQDDGGTERLRHPVAGPVTVHLAMLLTLILARRLARQHPPDTALADLKDLGDVLHRLPGSPHPRRPLHLVLRGRRPRSARRVGYSSPWPTVVTPRSRRRPSSAPRPRARSRTAPGSGAVTLSVMARYRVPSS